LTKLDESVIVVSWAGEGSVSCFPELLRPPADVNQADLPCPHL
jgi:hypothetical protein